MMGKTHVAGGLLASSATLLYIQNNSNTFYSVSTGVCVGAIYLFFSASSARLPDIDKKESTIGRRLWFISWPIFILQCICKIPVFLGIKSFRKISQGVDHRGFTHYPITWLIVSAMAAGYSWSIYSLVLNTTYCYLLIAPAAGICIGILSHLILDFFSGKIKLFAPLSLKGYGILLFKRSGLLEIILRIIMYFYSIYIIFQYITKLQ